MNHPDDKEFMLNPRKWPNWPYQTIKNNHNRKPGAFPRCGLLVEFSGPSEDIANADIRFVEANLYSVTMEDLAKAEKISIDKLLADGWVVD